MKHSRQHHLDRAEAILDDVATRQTEGRKVILAAGEGGVVDVSPQVMLLNVGLQMGATAALAHATLAAAMTSDDEL